METVTAFAARHQQHTAPVLTAEPEANRTLSVAVTYLLSEDGRKASLLAGGDGHAVQRLTVDVPANRLHLVSVGNDGSARLKLRPQFRREANVRIVRIDEDPTYDAPPTIEELFRAAAENHQLERSYDAERHAAVLKRRDADRARRAQLAQAFLTDQTQRALVHPAPTPKRCFLISDQGRVLFDVTKDDGPAKAVPAEAHRRFRADLRARRDENLRTRAAQLALHEEKTRVAAEWIAMHGTPEQQARQAAGVLPLSEAIEVMTDHAFAALADRDRYRHDGLARLQELVRTYQQHRDVMLHPRDLLVTSADARQMTAEHFEAVSEFRRLLPEATVTVRVHKLAWRSNPRVALPPLYGIVVTLRVGPFAFRREYVLPNHAKQGTD